jgi:hypothetical protein
MHMVYVSNVGTGCGLIVQFFGAFRYSVPLSESITLTEPAIWTFDPVAGTATRTSLGQLIAATPSPRSR